MNIVTALSLCIGLVMARNEVLSEQRSYVEFLKAIISSFENFIESLLGNILDDRSNHWKNYTASVPTDENYPVTNTSLATYTSVGTSELSLNKDSHANTPDISSNEDAEVTIPRSLASDKISSEPTLSVVPAQAIASFTPTVDYNIASPDAFLSVVSQTNSSNSSREALAYIASLDSSEEALHLVGVSHAFSSKSAEPDLSENIAAYDSNLKEDSGSGSFVSADNLVTHGVAQSLNSDATYDESSLEPSSNTDSKSLLPLSLMKVPMETRHRQKQLGGRRQ